MVFLLNLFPPLIRNLWKAHHPTSQKKKHFWPPLIWSNADAGWQGQPEEWGARTAQDSWPIAERTARYQGDESYLNFFYKNWFAISLDRFLDAQDFCAVSIIQDKILATDTENRRCTALLEEIKAANVKVCTYLILTRQIPSLRGA